MSSPILSGLLRVRLVLRSRYSRLPGCDRIAAEVRTMATLIVPDEVLRQAGLSEREALLEFACRLFDAGRLSLWSAAQLAGLDRNGMEDALLERNIPIYRPTAEDLAQDLANLDRLGV